MLGVLLLFLLPGMRLPPFDARPAGANDDVRYGGNPYVGFAWSAVYNGPALLNPDQPRRVATSPDGSRVYVTGMVAWLEYEWDITTIAYDAVTGTMLWIARDGAPTFGIGYDVLPSPDGALVYVTGSVSGKGGVTIAYDSVTGEQVWVAERSLFTNTVRLGLSLDGAVLYVGGSTASALAILALDAHTGEDLWQASSEAGPHAVDMVLDPGAKRAFLAGNEYPGGSSGDANYVVSAFDLLSRAHLWTRRYDSGAGNRDVAAAIDAAPGGTAVYVTGFIGRTQDESEGGDYGTVALAAQTGSVLWVARTAGARAKLDDARDVRASPWGDLVFVTGMNMGDLTDNDAVTVAYDAATGAQRWLQRYAGFSGEGGDWGNALELAPGGHRLYVTGMVQTQSQGANFVTLAYDAQSGSQHWVQWWRLFNDDPQIRMGQEDAWALALNPSGTWVYPTGIAKTQGYDDYGTVAYGPITEAPAASLEADRTSGEQPLTVTFTLVGLDPDGLVDGWKLDADGDRVADYASPSGLPPTQLTHIYTSPGAYTARLMVSDDHGAVGYDAVTITVTGTVSVGGPDPAASLALRGVRPNPSAGRLSVSLSLSSAEPATLELLDIAGRRVTARDVGALGAGAHVVVLAAGERLSPGVYLVRLTQGRRALSAKAVVVEPGGGEP